MAPAAATSDNKRTDEQILSQAPIQVRLGEVDYNIPPLRILAQRKWRMALIDSVKDIILNLKQQATSDTDLLSGLGQVLVQFPEKIVELVFAYAPDLPQDKVLAESTEEQIARAFGKIVQVAFPFTEQFQMISSIMGTPTKSQR